MQRTLFDDPHEPQTSPIVYKPTGAAKLSSWFIADSFTYTIMNAPIVPQGHTVLWSQIYERRIRGYHSLWRVSVVENEHGIYSLGETAQDIEGNPAGAITRFVPIPVEDIENKRVLEPIAKLMWKAWDRVNNTYRQEKQHAGSN